MLNVLAESIDSKEQCVYNTACIKYDYSSGEDLVYFKSTY
jgi:hypothetical protein